MRNSQKQKQPHLDQGLERNQVLYSAATEQYYFVPTAQRIGDEGMLRVKSNKINVTSSVLPLVAHAVAGHLRCLAGSAAFGRQGREKLLATAREVERKAGINAPSDEG